MVRQLVGMGFDHEAAEHQVSQQIEGDRIEAVRHSRTPNDTRQITWPLALTLPWSALISDNRKYAVTTRGPKRQPVIILSEPYRAAKEKIKSVARAKVAGATPAELPLQLVARVWVPDNRPGHDVANFAKCTHDALEKLVYTSDRWLHRITWERVGVDVDHPRAEVTIMPLPGAP